MERTILRRIQILYSILLSISLVVAGICLMAGCLVIYSSGDTPYSAQKVAETFSAVAVPVCIFPVLALLGIVLPRSVSAKNGKRSVSPAIVMGKDLSACDSETLSAVKKEMAGCKNRRVLLLGLSFLCGAVFLIYALLFAGGGEPDINGYMIRCMTVLLPCLAVPFGFGIYVSAANAKSFGRQWELVKKLPGVKKDGRNDASAQKRRYILLACLTVVSLALIVAGRMAGGAADVLTKAINICTECIGLG